MTTMPNYKKNFSLKSSLKIEKEKKLLATIPSGRFGTVEEVADCAAFIVSDEADYMNGAIILLDGGRLSV